MPKREWARVVSEREWLRGVGRMWELIRKSPNLLEYNRSTARMHLWS